MSMGKKRETYYYKDRNSKECFKYLALFGIWYLVTLLIIIRFLSEVMAPTPELINVFRFFFAVGIIFSAWSGYKYLSGRKVYKTHYRHTGVKYLMIGVILIFVTLVVVSAYTDIPQLEPIRKQIESFKGGMGVSKLAIGETGEIDGLAITVDKCELTDSWLDVYTIHKWDKITYDTIEMKPPKGAKFLFIYIKVENIGKTKKTFPPSYACPFSECISLRYDDDIMLPELLGNPLEYNPLYESLGEWGGYNYPGESKEGWITFEVPAGIEPEGTTLKIAGLVLGFKKFGKNFPEASCEGAKGYSRTLR